MVLGSNLTTWYLLPLIYLNKPSFGQGNFIESYVNLSGTILEVEVISIHMCHRDCLKSNYLMNAVETPRGHSSLFYWLPKKYQADFLRFKQGEFSKFSEKAKNTIREYSGLAYKAQYNGEQITDARLYALDKSPILRKAWEEDLVLLPLPADMELMPIPSERNYREYIHL